MMATYDYDMIIVGGGAAGLTVAAGAAQLGAKTVLIEKRKQLGGDCLNYGCVPSKTLIKAAKVYHYAKHLEKFGLPQLDVPAVDLKAVMGHVKDVINKVAVHDSVERFEGMGVEVIFGDAKFVSEHEITVNGKTLSGNRFTIATGSSPMVFPIEGLDAAGYVTNEEVFSLEVLPGRLVVLGAGPIGAELAHAFARLGSKVTLVDLVEYPISSEERCSATQKLGFFLCRQP